MVTGLSPAAVVTGLSSPPIVNMTGRACRVLTRIEDRKAATARLKADLASIEH